LRPATIAAAVALLSLAGNLPRWVRRDLVTAAQGTRGRRQVPPHRTGITLRGRLARRQPRRRARPPPLVVVCGAQVGKATCAA